MCQIFIADLLVICVFIQYLSMLNQFDIPVNLHCDFEAQATEPKNNFSDFSELSKKARLAVINSACQKRINCMNSI